METIDYNTIEIKVPCKIHGLEIFVSEGGKDYCEECMVES